MTGCALRYFDNEKGVEHIFGFSHIKYKAATENKDVRATIVQSQIVGLALDAGSENYGIAAGWDRYRKVYVFDNTTTSIYWPEGSFFDIRIGTNVPPSLMNLPKLYQQAHPISGSTN